MAVEGKPWSIAASLEGASSGNPLSVLFDENKFKANPDKKVISLSIGDPALYECAKAPEAVLKAVQDATKVDFNRTYQVHEGMVVAREAVAKKYTLPNNPLAAEDVFMMSGCAQAICYAMTATCDPRTNVVMPQPGYAMYKVNADSRQVEARFYDHIYHENGTCLGDLKQMESQIDEKTRLLILTNPHNPIGTVYTKEFLLEFIAIAERHRLPIFTDEVFGDVVFNGGVFHPLASLTDRVPILTGCAISKSYLVPGWRVGAMLVYDQHHYLKEVRTAIKNLCWRIFGPCNLVQAALPDIFKNVPKSFFDATNNHLELTSQMMFKKLSTLPCMSPFLPSAGFFIMIKLNMEELPGISDDLDFSCKLMAEESIQVLPQVVFGSPNFIRITLLASVEELTTAFERIEEFCQRHMRKS